METAPEDHSTAFSVQRRDWKDFDGVSLQCADPTDTADAGHATRLGAPTCDMQKRVEG
jgi:hypothetical protein